MIFYFAPQPIEHIRELDIGDPRFAGPSEEELKSRLRPPGGQRKSERRERAIARLGAVCF